MDIDECYKKGLIRETVIDDNLIASLIKIADIKERAVRKAEIDEEIISAYVSLAYDSLREILEALCISKGYKVLSHVCIGELLKHILDEFDFEKFDEIRKIRNGINYYGNAISFEEGKKAIKEIFILKKNILEKNL